MGAPFPTMKYTPPEKSSTPEAWANQLVSLQHDPHGGADHPDIDKPITEMPLNLAVERLAALHSIATNGFDGVTLQGLEQLKALAAIQYHADELDERLGVMRKRISADVTRALRAVMDSGTLVDGLPVDLNIGNAFGTLQSRMGTMQVTKKADKITYDEKHVAQILAKVDVILAANLARLMGVRATKTSVEALPADKRTLLEPARVVTTYEPTITVKES